METLLQDIRYGIRILAKSPGFTAVAVLTLALGIGANAAIFSVVNAVLLRPLPYKDSAQLVSIWARSSLFDFPNLGSSLPDIADVRSQSASLAQAAAYGYTREDLTGQGAPQQLRGAEVSLDFFPVLGIQPLYGRIFVSSEMQPGQERTVILGYELWRDRFGGDPHAIGRAVTLDEKPYTIVGVMPPQFQFPGGAELWIPLVPSKEQLSARGDHMYPLVARLKPGFTVEKAQAELDAIAARLAKAYPDADKNWGFRVASVKSDLVGDVRLPLLILFGAVGLVLLIACANVGNLFLSRGWARRRELAIRSTLGATRVRLVRQLLVESLLLAVFGGACGLLLAIWGVEGLRALLPAAMPRLENLRVDRLVFSFTLAASGLAGVFFGFAPALLVSRQDLSTAMKEGGAGSQMGASGPQRHSLRQLLAVGEVALAFVLVIGAALALRSFGRLLDVHLGFRADHVLTMRLDFPSFQITKPEQSVGYVRRILEQARTIPGVEAASAAMFAPISGGSGQGTFQIEGAPPSSPEPVAEWNLVAPGYFGALGVPFLAGRDFTDADSNGAPKTLIVNEALAQRYFGTTSPIGKRIVLGKDAKGNPEWSEIVGECGDVRDVNPHAAPRPGLYVPYYQADFVSGISLVARTKSDPMRLISAVQDRIWSIDKDQTITEVKTMDQWIAQSHAAPKFQTLLLGIFSGLGLALALVGIYGVISYSVTQRTHEIGVRLALGAEPQQVLRLILGQGARLALAGVALGIVASLVLTRLMRSLLFDVSATDPLTFTLVAILLPLVALAACYVPARRAMRVDPMVALRYE